MKKVAKLITSLALILGISFFSSTDGAEASTLIDSRQITSTSTSLNGTVSGSTQVCLRAAGSGWLYRPVVNVYMGNTHVASGQMAPGDCLSFNAGSSQYRNFGVNVSRTSLFGTFYFDLRS